MSEARATDTTARQGDASLTTSVGRYFFYAWMFRDASAGSELERAAALRHNRNLSKWLPTYLRTGFKPVRSVREIWDVPNRLGMK